MSYQDDQKLQQEKGKVLSMTLPAFSNIVMKNKNKNNIILIQQVAFLTNTSTDDVLERLYKACQKIEHDKGVKNDGSNTAISRGILDDIHHTFSFGLGPATIKLTVDLNLSVPSVSLTGTVEIMGFTVLTLGPITLALGQPVTIPFNFKVVSGKITFDLSQDGDKYFLKVSIEGDILFKGHFGPYSTTIQIWPL
eukprot:349325_1